MQSERVTNSIRNMATGIVSKLLDFVYPFIINTIIIKTLGIEYLGLNSLFASVLQVLSAAELGVGAALVYSMYEPMANGNTEKICYLLRLYRRVYLIIGAVVLVLGVACIPVLPLLIKKDIPENLNIYLLFIFSLLDSVAGYFLFAYRSSLLQAEQRIDIINKITILVNFLLNTAKIIVLICFKNYYLLCLLVPCFTVVNNIITFVVTRRRYPGYNCVGSVPKKEINDLKSRIFGLSLNKICSVLCNAFDTIVISGFLGLTILGKYNSYNYVMNALALILMIIMQSMEPSIGNSIVKESQEKNFEDFSVLQFGFGWLIGWMSVCLLCLYQPFIYVWLGEAYYLDDSIVIALSIFLYMVKISDVFMLYRQAAGIWAHDRIRPILETVLNLVLNIVFVKYFGVAGVVVSTILTAGCIRLVWGSFFLFREYFTEYSHRRFLLRMLYYLAVTGAAAVLTYWVCGFITHYGIGCLFIRAAICIILPNTVFAAAYFKLPEFRKLFVRLSGLLKGKGQKRR